MALIGLCLYSGPASATDKKGRYAVWGKGRTSCAAYIQARGQNRQEVPEYQHFIMGFLTATNVLMDDTYSVSGGKNLKEILSWLDGHCTEQAMSSFEAAISKFVTEHFTQRQQQADKGW